MSGIGVAHRNCPIPPQKWEKYKRIKNHKKRLEIISMFMTSLLQKKYEDAIMLCMIGLKSEPKNLILQDFYYILSEKLDDLSSSDISSDEEINENKMDKEEKIQSKRNVITENKSDRENDRPHCSQDNNTESDNSSTSEEEDESTETSSDSSESDDYELEVSDCSSTTVHNLRSKVVPPGPPPKLDPKWLPR